MGARQEVKFSEAVLTINSDQALEYLLLLRGGDVSRNVIRINPLTDEQKHRATELIGGICKTTPVNRTCLERMMFKDHTQKLESGVLAPGTSVFETLVANWDPVPDEWWGRYRDSTRQHYQIGELELTVLRAGFAQYHKKYPTFDAFSASAQKAA